MNKEARLLAHSRNAKTMMLRLSDRLEVLAGQCLDSDPLIRQSAAISLKAIANLLAETADDLEAPPLDGARAEHLRKTVNKAIRRLDNNMTTPRWILRALHTIRSLSK